MFCVGNNSVLLQTIDYHIKHEVNRQNILLCIIFILQPGILFVFPSQSCDIISQDFVSLPVQHKIWNPQWKTSNSKFWQIRYCTSNLLNFLHIHLPSYQNISGKNIHQLEKVVHCRWKGLSGNFFCQPGQKLTLQKDLCDRFPLQHLNVSRTCSSPHQPLPLRQQLSVYCVLQTTHRFCLLP